MVRSGARRFVVVRYLTEARDPRTSALRLLDTITAALEPAGGKDR
jgi:hypothetical protein